MRFWAVLVVALFLFGCDNDVQLHEHGTRLLSKDFPDKAERIKILSQEFNFPSEVNDVEFDLFNVNGFSHSRTLLPGASSVDYRVAVKVDTTDIKKWIGDMVEIQIDDSADISKSVFSDLIKYRENEWNLYSRPRYFITRDIAAMEVYYPEGIIFKRVKN